MLTITADKNQYVHRRDSVSLASLSEQEIQKRMKLGLVTNAPRGAPSADDEELEDWEDIQDDGKESSEEGTDDDYIFDAKRRSSVDLDNMTTNLHDQQWENTSNGGVAGFTYQGDNESNKRQCARKPMVASICEESAGADDEEIATVDGDDVEDMELRDADGS
jgi:hypothetical protein